MWSEFRKHETCRVEQPGFSVVTLQAFVQDKVKQFSNDMVLNTSQRNLLLWDIYISVWFTNTKICFRPVVSGDFIWFSFLNLFSSHFFVFVSLWLLTKGEVEGFRFAVTLTSAVEMFAVLLTETIKWQLVENKWECVLWDSVNEKTR